MFRVNDHEQTEFVLSELLPDKQYFLKTIVNIRDDNMESGYQVRNDNLMAFRNKLQDKTFRPST